MAWVRMDDTMPRGPKMKRAALALAGGDIRKEKRSRGRILGVWADAMAYCNSNLTDGFLPDFELSELCDDNPLEVLQAMAQGTPKLGAIVERDDDNGGWVFRNYDQYQKTKAEIEDKQQRDRERKRGGFRGGSTRNPSGIHAESTRNPHDTDADSVHPGPARPDPAQTGPAQPDPATALVAPVSATVTRFPQRSTRKHGLSGGVHPSCDDSTWGACARGICVPPFVVRAWREQLGHKPDTSAKITEFVDAVMARVPEGDPIGDEPVKFWRGQWLAVHGSAVPARQGTTKSDITRDNARIALESILAKGSVQ